VIGKAKGELETLGLISPGDGVKMDCYLVGLPWGYGNWVIFGKRSLLLEVCHFSSLTHGMRTDLVELSLLVGLSVLYMTTRHHTAATAQGRSPTAVSFARPGSPFSASFGSHVRERSNRMSHSTGTPSVISNIRDDLRRVSPTGFNEDGTLTEPKGSVWGTEAREYR
jgi:hypothetical protein